MGLQWDFTGVRERITVREWAADRPSHIVLLAHGYGEHIARYDYAADLLVRDGAAVYGPDHIGHGRSDGERVLISDFEEVVTDLETVANRARTAHPGLPVVLVGHSMGGMIAARHAQRHGSTLAALVLSGPVLGPWSPIKALLALDEIPDIPIDPATLSRDLTVGEAYAGDELVWHGPFKRQTVEAFDRCLTTIASGGTLGSLPTLWVHGTADELVPLSETRTGIEQIRGTNLTEIIYEDARHEVFNETNRDQVLGDVRAFIGRHIRTSA